VLGSGQDESFRVTAMRIVPLIVSAVLLVCTPGCAAESTVWTFDRTDSIGGAPAHAEGQPKVIETAAGPAAQFDGVKDMIFIDAHPLAGAEKFTVEAVFRPDGGPFEQRWMHLAEVDQKTGQDTGTRFLFEIRVVGGRWYLDAFTKGIDYNKTLIVPEKTFPVGRWYHVAMTYDGKTFRSYVDGVAQAEGEIAFKPQGPGHSSVGARINRINYFRGALFEARFSPRALKPDEFLTLPAGLNASVK
jgi:hypothetical protein